MLLSRVACEVGLDLTQPEDYVTGHMGLIVNAIHDLYHRGSAIDVSTVTQRLEETNDLTKVGGKSRIMRVAAQTPASMNTRSYAETVARFASARRAMFVGNALIQAGREADLEQVDEVLRGAEGRVAMPGAPVEPALQIDDFMAQPVAQPDWLVPGTLERRDRLILTGAEGGGKSVWMRQLGWCCALGQHPFDGTSIRRCRVLHIDCENSPSQITRGYQMLAGVRRSENMPLFVTSRLQGLDLTTRRDASWLLGMVKFHRADLLVIGPLYKMHKAATEDATHEAVAKQTAQAFDVVRAQTGAAILIEAHAPFGTAGNRNSWRPFGSSFWLRWPEFGYGMAPCANDSTGRRQMEVVEWRGPRDDTRRWPSVLTRMDGAGTWPWRSNL